METLSINIKDLISSSRILRAGMKVFLSGEVFTARDAAHKRLVELIEKKQELPIDLKGACIYYAGPTPTPPGLVIGSCGPTTSGRMDVYTPTLLSNGVKGLIGKGSRSNEVKQAIIDNEAVYFCALGGAGALASKCITENEEIAFEDLECESIKRLVFKNFPLLVCIDSLGNDFYDKI